MANRNASDVGVDLLPIRRSERKIKRKVHPNNTINKPSKNKIKKSAPPNIARIELSKEPPKEINVTDVILISEKPPEELLEASVNNTVSMKRRKKKTTIYEVDCTRVDLDTINFRKDLWSRAKNGKFKSTKNIKIRLAGKILSITTRCYIPKKCIRSNIHFLMEGYLKKKKIDRPIRVVGDRNVYKLVYQ